MEASPCSACQSPTSAFVCYCETKYFCQGCLSFHLLNNPFVRHNPVALEGHEKAVHSLAESEDIPIDEQSVDSLSARSENSQARELLQRELSRLTAYRASALEQLQQVREQWISEILRATAEIEAILTEKCEMMAREIQHCLGELEEVLPSPTASQALKERTRRDSMLDLCFDLRPIDLNTLIKQFVNFSLNYSAPAADSCFLYKFFGGQGCVSCFDATSERVTNSLQSGEKFLHNSSWVLAPSGEIYITGGSLMGKSKDDVIMFVPDGERTEVLGQMNTPRRSHATVFLQDTLYVFGGIYEEQKIALSESMSVSTRHWVKCSDMNRARAYLGSTVFLTEIYLGGGADTSSIEVFHPDAQTYDYISLQSLSLTEACALIAVDDKTILIFHGNYQGEVLAYRPGTQEVTKVCDMCHGNSWSNCAPLRYKDAIYTLRSDSVFKFDMQTATTSYIIRITKSSKKRKCGDEMSL